MSTTTDENSALPSDATNDRADLQSVIDLVMRREQDRKKRVVRRAKKRRHEENESRRRSDDQLREAIHVIKWCVVGICSVMVLGMILGVWAVVQVEQAVVEVERDVEQITTRVDNILHEVEHPFEGAAKLLGRDFDKSVAALLGLRENGSGGNDK